MKGFVLYAVIGFVVTLPIAILIATLWMHKFIRRDK